MQGTISFDGTLSGGITGGGGGGSEVTITPILSSGTKIADYDIDGTPGELYAPTPESLTAQAPLDITSGVISIDLSNYVTDSDLSNYQEKLTAGSYISIDSDNEISCDPPIKLVWYTPEASGQDILIGKLNVNGVAQNIYVPDQTGLPNITLNEELSGRKFLGVDTYIRCIDLGINVAIPHNSWYDSTISCVGIGKILDVKGTNDDGDFYPLNSYKNSFNNFAFLACRSNASIIVRYIIIEYTKS